MKKNEVKMVLLLVIIVVIIIAIMYFLINGNKDNKVETNEEGNSSQEYVTTLEDGTKINTSEGVNKEKRFEGLTIKNIQLTNRDNKTELVADIENTSKTDKEAMLIDIILYNKEGKEIGKIGGRISPIKAGETKQFSTTAMKDYSDIYDFEFKLKK